MVSGKDDDGGSCLGQVSRAVDEQRVLVGKKVRSIRGGQAGGPRQRWLLPSAQ